MDMSVRPPRVLTRSFPLMTVPFTAGAPCSYWTLTCLAVSSALHSLMGFLFVSPVVCSRLPSDSISRWTPLPFSYPFPTAGQGRDFHPIERAPAGRTTKIPTHQEPVFFERVVRVYPSETTKNYVNRVVFRLLQYVKMCGDPIAINHVSTAQ